MIHMGQLDTEWIFTLWRQWAGGWTIEYLHCVHQGQADTPLNIMLMMVMGQLGTE